MPYTAVYELSNPLMIVDCLAIPPTLSCGIDLVYYLCSAAYNDLRWLSEKQVHGAGSVVRYGTAGQIGVIVRPEVWRDYGIYHYRCAGAY